MERSDVTLPTGMTRMVKLGLSVWAKNEAGEEPEVQEGAENPEGDELDVAGEAEGDVTIYTVAVYPGEGSYTVSRKLAALGLVESANLFDDFLCQNGYDKKLCTGNYRVKEGANAEEIAKVLTGQLVY